MHLEAIAYQATAPSTGAAAAAVTGDSLTIKNSKGPAMILAMWAHNQSAGYHQLSIPSGHDTTRGFRFGVSANEIANRLTLGVGMPVEPQELISATINGSATAGDVETGILQVLYRDLPGVASRTIRWSELVRRAAAYTTISATLTGAAAGWTGSEVLTAESDLLRANRDYAVLGITTNTECAAVSISGPDTGYQRCAVPGNAENLEDAQSWFCSLARAYDAPLIPVINSGNKAATKLEICQNENNVSPLVTVFLALLDK